MLLENRLTLMQRIQDCAHHRYFLYIRGEIAQGDWPKFELKLAGLYETDLSKTTRSRRRRSGEAVALLYACKPAPYAEVNAPIRWVMMVTEGRGRVHGRENLSDIRNDRLQLEGYELVHDGCTWSWKMTKERFQYWRERIHAVAAKRPGVRATGQDHIGRFDPDIEKIMDSGLDSSPAHCFSIIV